MSKTGCYVMIVAVALAAATAVSIIIFFDIELHTPSAVVGGVAVAVYVAVVGLYDVARRN
jgi:membrane protein YdbS with pleckstrin-like domain